MLLPREPLLNQLSQRERRYVELEQRVAQLASASNAPEYQQLSKELAQLKELSLFGNQLSDATKRQIKNALPRVDIKF